MASGLADHKARALIQLKTLLEPFGIETFYTAGWGAYERHLDSPQPVVGQGNTQWTIDQIIAALSRPLPKSVLDTKKRGGNSIAYMPWYTANQILDKYAPGWTWEIRDLKLSGDRLFLVGRLTIPTQEGNVYREATGTELLKDSKVIKDGDGNPFRDDYDRPLTEAAELAYAESMSFRRAAAKFGLGLYLYEKD